MPYLKEKWKMLQKAMRGGSRSPAKKFIHFRFADAIDGLAGIEKELTNLIKHIDNLSSVYDMQINAKKKKKKKTTHENN